MLHPSTSTVVSHRADANFRLQFGRTPPRCRACRDNEQESRSDPHGRAPTVVGMCFMFGASEDQVRRVIEEARHAREDAQAGSAGGAPDRHARQSSSTCPDPPP
jgi:hypothetical protein